jgi:hypothetical protein
MPLPREQVLGLFSEDEREAMVSEVRLAAPNGHSMGPTEAWKVFMKR